MLKAIAFMKSIWNRMVGRFVGLVPLIASVCIILFLSTCGGPSEKEPLVLYCAAGVKPAIEQLAREYEEKFGVRIDIQYGGSGTLLSSLRITGSGDLFLAADESYIEEAIKLGLVAEVQPLAEMRPVLAVKKGNKKKVQGIADLEQGRVSFALSRRQRGKSRIMPSS